MTCRILLLVWNFALIVKRFSDHKKVIDLAGSNTFFTLAPYVAVFIMQISVVYLQHSANYEIERMSLPVAQDSFGNINFQDYSSTMRNVAKSYYNEAFVDTLSIFINWVSITLLFENILVFVYFWRTLKNMYALVNLSLAYFIILCAGLTFANMAFHVSSDGRYLSFTNAFAMTLIPFATSDSKKTDNFHSHSLFQFIL